MKKKIIWIVDDDIIYQTIAKKLIQKAGIFVSHSSFFNGKQAITTLNNALEDSSENIPDIILLDINMPVMDGWEFMEELKNITPQIDKPIFIYIVSSSIAIEDRQKSETYADILGYLPKPITVSILTAIASEE